MIHWSPSRTAALGRTSESAFASEDETPLAQRLMLRVVTQLGDALRQFQRQASLRATAFGWESASIRTSEDVWMPCPQCQGAGMDRLNIPVPQDVFECPACHAVVADACPVTYPIGPSAPPPVDLTAPDYDPWIIDDPRR